MKKKDSRNLWYGYLLVVFIVSLVLLCFAMSNDIKANDSWEEFSTYLEEDVPMLLESYDIPGANIALIENGEVKMIKSYGSANIEQESSMTPDKLFRADSISKMFTAWGIMNLVEEEKINLDDPAENYLTRWNFPETEFNKEKITIRMLLSHRAGLPSGIYDVYTAMDEEIPSLEKSLLGKAGAPAAKLVQPPGDSFTYSNPGFGVLELIIEEVTGRKYSDYMKEEILTPLGMNNSGFELTKEVKSNIVTNYDMNRESVPLYREPVKGHGELHTTVEDLTKFLTAWMNNSQGEKPGRNILKLQSINELHTPEVKTTGMYKYFSDSYGLGHFIEKLPNGQQIVFHGGEGVANANIACGIPEMGRGIIILTNSNGSWQFLASILDNWIDYLGIEWKGISHIFQVAKIGAKVTLTMVLFISILVFWKLTKGFFSGQRKFKPLSKKSRILRLLQFTLAVLIMGIWWGTSIKEILFWLLPNLSVWLEVSLLIFSLLLILLVMFTKEPKSSNINT